MQRLLVGSDGVETATDALHWSADLAQCTGLDVVVARVHADPGGAVAGDLD